MGLRDQDEKGDDDDATEAGAVERQRDGKPAPVLEAKPQDVGDGAHTQVVHPATKDTANDCQGSVMQGKVGRRGGKRGAAREKRKRTRQSAKWHR